MRRVIDHLKWERFILVTHSVGFITGKEGKRQFSFLSRKCISSHFLLSNLKAGRGAVARGVTAKPTGCGFDPHSRR